MKKILALIIVIPAVLVMSLVEIIKNRSILSSKMDAEQVNITFQNLSREYWSLAEETGEPNLLYIIKVSAKANFIGRYIKVHYGNNNTEMVRRFINNEL